MSYFFYMSFLSGEIKFHRKHLKKLYFYDIIITEINEKTKEILKLYLVHNMKDNIIKGSYQSHLSYISLKILRSMKRREIEDDK